MCFTQTKKINQKLGERKKDEILEGFEIATHELNKLVLSSVK